MGYGKWFRGTHACSRHRDTGSSATRKSVPETNPTSVYSQRSPAASHGWQEGRVSAAKPTSRLGHPLYWLDTQDGHHDVPLPDSPLTQLGPEAGLSYESTNRKQSLERCPLAQAV